MVVSFSFIRFLRVSAAFAFLTLLASYSFAADAKPSAAPPILPKQFSGWTAASIQASASPTSADPVNAALLAEYGFTDFEGATYTRESDTLTVKAARFADASGAYGAFTFYKLPQMQNEKIGGQAGSLNERVLFYQGNVLVDAVFQKLTAMSAAELRELAAAIPPPPGNTGNLPSLPAYLPKESYEKNSARYIMGPVGLDHANDGRNGAAISAQLVDFSAGAEVALGNYATSTGDATLMLISYPTPQIAADHLRKIEASFPPGNSQTIFDKRTGPIVVIVSGNISSSEAKALLASVTYEADVTWNENTHFTKKDNVANLLVNVIVLCGIILGFAVAVGVAFGGVRILVKRFWPDRFFDRPEDVELVSLHLSDRGPRGAELPAGTVNPNNPSGLDVEVVVIERSSPDDPSY